MVYLDVCLCKQESGLLHQVSVYQFPFFLVDFTLYFFILLRPFSFISMIFILLLVPCDQLSTIKMQAFCLYYLRWKLEVTFGIFELRSIVCVSWRVLRENTNKLRYTTYIILNAIKNTRPLDFMILTASFPKKLSFVIIQALSNPIQKFFLSYPPQLQKSYILRTARTQYYQ